MQTIEGSLSGLLNWTASAPFPGKTRNQWLYGLDAGVADRNVTVTSVCVPARIQTGIAVSTLRRGRFRFRGQRQTWSYILNQASVGGNLGSIRMVPSVIEAGGSALVAYKVNKDSKITIEVFSYDMRKIRTIVKRRAPFRKFHASPSPRKISGTAGRIWTRRRDGRHYVRVKMITTDISAGER